MNRPRSLFRSRPHGGPSFMPRVLEIGKTLTPGTTAHVSIYHNEGCSFYRGGDCDCDPEVKLEPAPNVDRN